MVLKVPEKERNKIKRYFSQTDTSDQFCHLGEWIIHVLLGEKEREIGKARSNNNR